MLSTTALVHEAYLRLVDDQGIEWQNRAHFFGIASRVMRRVIVDNARKHCAQKRGGGQIAESLLKLSPSLETDLYYESSFVTRLLIGNIRMT